MDKKLKLDTQISRSKRNFRRDRIIKDGLMQYIDDIALSKRNRAITIDYVNGISFKELSEKYGISYKRAPQIIGDSLNKLIRYKNSAIKEKGQHKQIKM